MVRPASRALAGGLATLLALAGLALPAAARADDVPAGRQALLLLRVLAYDRNLRQRAEASVTVAILYREGDRPSEARRDGLAEAFRSLAATSVVSGLPIKVEAVPVREPADLEARLAALRPALAYVDPGLADHVGQITRLSRRLGVLTADGSRALVEAGLAVSVVAARDRATIVVNLGASRREGVDFDATMLALSEVVRPSPEPNEDP